MKKVFLFFSVALLALVACNKQDDVVNIETTEIKSIFNNASKLPVKAGGGHWTPWIYDYYYDSQNNWKCKKGTAKNCSLWIPDSSTMENLDNAINAGPEAIASFFLNEIEGTELESMKNDREIYAKFISGDLYAQKIINEEGIVYRFYEVIDNKEVNFVIIKVD